MGFGTLMHIIAIFQENSLLKNQMHCMNSVLINEDNCVFVLNKKIKRKVVLVCKNLRFENLRLEQDFTYN